MRLLPEGPQAGSLKSTLTRAEKKQIVKAMAVKARRRLGKFCSFTLPIYKSSKHLDILDDTLEKVERGEITRLMIFMPPRHGKSEKTSIRFPAWYLGRNPDKKIIHASYSASLSNDMSRQTRDLVEEPKYRLVFPGITTNPDSRNVTGWNLLGYRGGLISAGVGGAITGYGADLLLIDDPVKNLEEAESEVYRKRAWDWYRSVARTRLHKGAAIVLMMTRWHPNDLAGKIIKQDGIIGGQKAEDGSPGKWVVINLVGLVETKEEEAEDPLGRKIGEALWPEEYTAEYLKETKKEVGTRIWAALFQGKPKDPEGQKIKREWIQWYGELPEHYYRCAGIDTATSLRDSADNTALVDVCRNDFTGKIYIDDCLCDKYTVSGFARVVNIQNGVKKYRKIYIEKNNAGEAIKQRIDEVGKEDKEIGSAPPVEGLTTTVDKMVRVMGFQHLIENGTILFNKNNPRVVALVEHLLNFDGKGGDIDDDVDALGFGIKAVLEAKGGAACFTVTHDFNVFN